jgi:arylesterase/paraoxonase
VEIFERGTDGLFAHVETLHNPLLVAPNAIVAVGPRQFYVANFSGASPGIERFIEMYFGRAQAEIVYFDGDVMRAVDEPIALGTGIAASADGGRVYVSEANAGRMRIYSRDSETGGGAGRVCRHPIPDNEMSPKTAPSGCGARKPYRLLESICRIR